MATEPAKSALCTELGGATPRVIAALSEDEIADLASAIAEAKRRQSEELSEAADAALRNVPRLFRGAAKRVLLG